MRETPRLRAWLLTLLVAFAAASPARSQPQLDASAVLPSGDAASEYWDLVAEFADGHRLFARFLITNAGPGDHNAVAVGSLLPPDGETIRFHNARRRGNWQLSDDRLRLDIGKSHLDLHGPERRYEISKKSTRLVLQFGGTQGHHVPAERLPQGYAVDLVEHAAPASGWYRRKGDADRTELRDGRLSLIHTVSAKEEARQVRRRIEVLDLQASSPLYLIDWISPGGSRDGWWVGGTGPADGTSAGADTSQITLALEGTADGWKDADYWVPGRLSATGPHDLAAIQVGPILQTEDSLRELPAPFRWVLGLRMRPKRVWAGARIGGRLSAAPETAPHRQGRGLVTFSFLDELSRESDRTSK